MKPARSNTKREPPYSWSQFKNGRWVSESIQVRLDEWYPKLFGYHMLKLGGLSCELSSAQSNIQHQVHLDIQNSLHNIIADPTTLPFAQHSFDVALLAHQLDYSADPHRILREVDRTMMDDGYLIITGFNPFSFIGLSSLMPWRKAHLPWSGRMFTPNRVKDWLSLLNYQIIECECYAQFPMQTYRTLWAWVEGGLGRWASSVGCVYFIVARKRTFPLKPIPPHRPLKRRLAPIGANYRLKE